MIGHFLLTLEPEQEERLLTGKMAGLLVLNPTDFAKFGGCLLQVVDGATEGPRKEIEDYDEVGGHVGCQYDDLCHRFGTDRIHVAIRNRILTNQARRLGITGPVPAREVAI